MKARAAIFFDFDSTVVTKEALEEVIALALRDKAPEEREALLGQVSEITNLGMEGKLDFRESVKRRLSTVPLSQTHFETVGTALLRAITPGMEDVFSYLHGRGADIYIVSGGFEEFLFPAAESLNIKRTHCFANRCTYDDAGVVIGVDESAPAWTSDGKHPTLAHITIRDNLTGTKIMVGDGSSDLAAYEHGAADHFIAFTGNAARTSVIDKAPYVAKDSGELRAILEELMSE